MTVNTIRDLSVRTTMDAQSTANASMKIQALPGKLNSKGWKHNNYKQTTMNDSSV